MATFFETALQDLGKLCQEYTKLQKDPEISKCVECIQEQCCDDIEKAKRVMIPLEMKQKAIFVQAMKLCIGEDWRSK